MRLRAEAITAYLGRHVALAKFAVMDDSSTYFVKAKARDSATARNLAKKLSKRCEVVEIGNSLFCWIKGEYNWTISIFTDYVAQQKQAQQEGTGGALTAE